MTKSDLLKIIRAKCLDCGCGSIKEVELCPAKGCALYELRFGKDPHKRVLSPERKAALAVTLAKGRNKNKDMCVTEIKL